MEILFLLSHIPNPRMNKRIAVAKQYGNVVVVCVRRASQNIWEPYHTDVRHEIICIDLPAAKHPIKRYFASNSYRKEANRFLRVHSPNLIYTEGLDSLSIAVAYQNKNKKCRIFYEVADIREIFLVPPKSPIQRLIRTAVSKAEESLLKHVDQLIVTSEKFFELYYCKYFDRDHVLFLHNVPDKSVFIDFKKKQDGHFTVGFIGGIRYLKQMEMLVDAAEECDVDVLFAGQGGTAEDDAGIHDYCKGKRNVKFFGRYAYESQIAQLYGKVDCVYAVYDAENPNVRIALPNKLYESVYCGLPIIVAKGTYLAEIVEKYGVGIAVTHNKAQELVDTIMRLKQKECLKGYEAACGKFKQELLFFDCQDDALGEKIKGVSQEG